GIETRPLSPAEALRLEPTVNPTLLGAVQVPDGTIDPFRLTAANMLDAREHGATILTGCEMTGLIRCGERVCGVEFYDHQHRE
ncbi:FAD-dependent oxidoreductase, partial [Klebsiella pneumoniae]|nr:FAD-dependent oxidoreductase [Klebsiella pneumoniae]